jgi:hypothetical protein
MGFRRIGFLIQIKSLGSVARRTGIAGERENRWLWLGLWRAKLLI